MTLENRSLQRQSERARRSVDSFCRSLAVEVRLRMPRMTDFDAYYLAAGGEFSTDAGYTASYSPERIEEHAFLPERVTVRKGRSVVILGRGYQSPWELKKATGGRHKLTDAALRNFAKAALNSVRRHPVPHWL